MAERPGPARSDRELSASVVAVAVLVVLGALVWGAARLAPTVGAVVGAVFERFESEAQAPPGHAIVSIDSGPYTAFVVLEASEAVSWWNEEFRGVPERRFRGVPKVVLRARGVSGVRPGPWIPAHVYLNDVLFDPSHSGVRSAFPLPGGAGTPGGVLEVPGDEAGPIHPMWPYLGAKSTVGWITERAGRNAAQSMSTMVPPNRRAR